MRTKFLLIKIIWKAVVVSDSRIITEQNTILAKKAFLVSDSESMTVKLRLENGSIHTVSSDLKNYRKIDFNNYDINLDLSTALANLEESSKSSTEMTMTELLEKMKKPGMDKAAIRELAIEVHKKFSIPLSCIFFRPAGVAPGYKKSSLDKIAGLCRWYYCCFLVLFITHRRRGSGGNRLYFS